MDTPAILANYIGLLLRVVLQSTQVILVRDRMDQFKIEISVHKWQMTRFMCNFFHPEGYYDFLNSLVIIIILAFFGFLPAWLKNAWWLKLCTGCPVFEYVI